MRLTTITISEGNIKTGLIPSFSLLPFVSCSVCARYTCFLNGCYAKNMMLRRKNVYKSWQRNTDAITTNRGKAFSEINAYLTLFKPSMFRIHVGGDFIDPDYFDRWLSIAYSHPDTRFLAFTKRYEWLPFEWLPENLQIVLSAWPGIDMPESNLSKAWMYDKNNIDERIPKTAIQCSGNCINCGVCWGLSKAKLDVVFNKH